MSLTIVPAGVNLVKLFAALRRVQERLSTNANAPSSMTAVVAPIAMPAIAPPLSPPLFGVAVEGGEVDTTTAADVVVVVDSEPVEELYGYSAVDEAVAAVVSVCSLG